MSILSKHQRLTYVLIMLLIKYTQLAGLNIDFSGSRFNIEIEWPKH